MVSTQRSNHTVRNQLNKEEKIRFSKKGIQSVFCQRHSSRTGYHDRDDWLQYRINLVTRVPVNFQQKTSFALNNRLDSQKHFGFSACTRYVKWCLFYVFLFFTGNLFDHGNTIVGNKYRNGEINKMIIVIIVIYSTYLFKWCATIPNDGPVPFWITYWLERNNK